MLVLFTVPKCVKLWRHLLLQFDLIKSCVVLVAVLHFAGTMRHFAVWVGGFVNYMAYFEKTQPCLHDCALALGEKKQPCNQENVAFEEQKSRRTYWFDDGHASDQRPLMDRWMFHLQTERSPSSLIPALSRASQAFHLNCLGHLGEPVVK